MFLPEREEKNSRGQKRIKFSTIPMVQITITGIDRDGESIKIKGKPRGKCVLCDHKQRGNELVMDAYDFLRAACSIRHFI